MNDPNELRQTPDAVVPVLVPCSLEAAKSPHLPPDLARVVATWDRLPEAIKAAIVALADAGRARDVQF